MTMRQIFRHTLLVLAALTVTLTNAKEDGLKVYRLRRTNTMIRVASTARYMLLPIEESAADDRIDVLLDGKTVFTLYARLAM
jgi:squalene cyclase